MRPTLLFLAAACAFALPPPARAADDPAENWRALVAAGELVEVAKLDPTLRVELRYATARNGAGVPLYPADFPCLLRPAVAEKLLAAQRFLRPFGCGLKIWDAYRPAAAQRELWRRVGVRRYVANPDASGFGSMHGRGAAVDVTLVDLDTGRERRLPTDFDVFSLAAVGIYRGPDPEIAANLRLLHRAMMAGGFLAQYREWWHFTARDWKKYPPLVPGKPPSGDPSNFTRAE